MERIPATDLYGAPIYDRRGRKCYTWSYEHPNYKRYPFRILEWLSQGMNVFWGGHQDLTFSQRAGAWAYHGTRKWPAKIIDAVMGENHCEMAWRKKV